MEKATEQLTDEQLWLLCLEEEKKKKITTTPDNYRDKAVDYEFWGMMYEKSKDLK
jgi:hypothetical protein